MKPWRIKARQIIAMLCRDAWAAANLKKNGMPYKRHRAYAVPLDAELLIEALNKDNEELAKAIFMRHAYNLIHR